MRSLLPVIEHGHWRYRVVTKLQCRKTTTLPKKTGLGSGPYQLSLVCVEFEETGGHPLANLGNTQFQLSGSRLQVVAMTVQIGLHLRVVSKRM